MKRFLFFLIVFTFVMALFINQALSSDSDGMIYEVTWRGLTADKIGKDTNGNPDGAKDGQFHITFNMAKKTNVLTSIAVYQSNKTGQKSGSQIWHSGDKKYWILGVYNGGLRLNPLHKTPLGQYWGGQTVVLDLYCADSGFFKNGQYFLVEIIFGDGSKASKLIAI